MVVKQVLRYVCIIVGLVGLLSTSVLQYSHDTNHRNCSTENREHSGQKPTAADQCALCWFVSHQLTPDLRLEACLPEVAIHDLKTLVSDEVTAGYQNVNPLRKSNKDPPSFV